MRSDHYFDFIIILPFIWFNEPNQARPGHHYDFLDWTSVFVLVGLGFVWIYVVSGQWEVIPTIMRLWLSFCDFDFLINWIRWWEKGCWLWLGCCGVWLWKRKRAAKKSAQRFYLLKGSTVAFVPFIEPVMIPLHI